MYCWLSFGGSAANEIIRQSHFKEDQYTMISSDIQNIVRQS